MRNRLFAVLVLAVVAGGGLAYATYNYMQGATSVKTVSLPTQPVVLAAADLQIGTELKADDLRVVQWPKGQAPEGAFTNPSQIVGRGLITPLARNEVIGVAGYVLPGAHVDVLATASPTQQVQDTTTKLVLSNIPVLAAGTRLEQDQKDGKPVQVSVITLMVSPEQAERLALASTEGKVQLALRNPLDQGAPQTPGIKPAALLGNPTPEAPKLQARPYRPVVNVQKAKPAVTAPVEAPMPTVEVIRGDKRTNEVIK